MTVWFDPREPLGVNGNEMFPGDALMLLEGLRQRAQRGEPVVLEGSEAVALLVVIRYLLEES